jgi:hypothetical protein
VPLIPMQSLPLPPHACQVCARGCGCQLGSPGCGHYGCYGNGPHDCPGIAAEEARYEAAMLLRLAEEARALNRRARWAAAYRAAVATTAPHLPTP